MLSEHFPCGHNPHSLCRLALVLSLLFAAGRAGATEPDAPGGGSTPDLASMPLEALMQVTVRTATLLSQSGADAPAAVVVLTAQDIRAFGWRTLAEALASLPGLYTSYDRTYTYLGGRGFQRPGDYNLSLIHI